MPRTILALAALPALALPAPAPAAEFTLFLFETDAELARRADPAEASPDGYWGAWGAYAQRLAEAGALRGGTALRAEDPTLAPAGASGEGSAAPREPRLSGYLVIEAPDRAAADAWAAMAPSLAAGGAAEVREAVANPLMAPGSK